MANNLIEELLKKLGIGGAAQVDPTALPAGSQRPIEQVMSGDQQAKPAHRKTILNAFLPEQTEDETSARRRGLFRMGAQMLADSGASYEPKDVMGIAGRGLMAGLDGYDNEMDGAQKRLLTGAKVAANDAALKQQQANAAFAGTLGGSGGSGAAVGATAGGMGYSEDQLMQIYKHLMANGEFAEASKVLAMVQELRKTAAGKGMVVGEDGTLVSAPGYTDGIERNSRAEDEGKYTADRKNYDLYVEQTTAKGETPVDFNTWQKDQKAAGSTKVNVNTGENSSKYAEKSDEEAAKRHNQIIEEANNAPQMIGDMDMLLELGRNIGTGKFAEFTLLVGPYAEAMGIDIDGLAPAQAFDAVVNRLVPNMRPAGSGAMSDFDAKMFLKSLPNIGNTPEGNEVIAITMRAVQENKLAAAAIARRAQKGEIKWTEADEEISKLPNPYQRFKAYQEEKRQAGIDITTRIKQAQAAPKAADDNSLPRISTPEEADALPSGTWFIAPDGSKKLKK